MLKFSKKDRQDEFLDLMHANQGIVIKVCRMYTNAKNDYEDLYQEVLIQSWQSFSRFKGDSKFSTWLYKVCLNTALTSKKKQRSFLTDDIDEEKAIYVADADQYESKDLLEAAMALLNDTDKAFLVLYMDGYSYEEIADSLRLNVGTVKSRIARARQNLRALIAEACPEFSTNSSPSEWFEPARSFGRLAVATA